MPLPKGEVKFEIIQKIAVLGPASRGWTKELNIVSWNGRDAKYDIREWAPDHESMGKGVTLNEAEARALCAALTADLELADAQGGEPIEDEESPY